MNNRDNLKRKSNSIFLPSLKPLTTRLKNKGLKKMVVVSSTPVSRNSKISPEGNETNSVLENEINEWIEKTFSEE